MMKLTKAAAMAAILLLAAVALFGCSGSYSWGPSGRSLNIGIDPAMIAPGIGFVEQHWADEH